MDANSEYVDLGVEEKESESTTYKKTIRWRIKNYLDWAKGIEGSECSPTFEIVKNDDKEYTFSFQIHPHGNKAVQNTGGYVSAYLQNDSSKDLRVKFKLFVIKNDGSNF